MAIGPASLPARMKVTLTLISLSVIVYFATAFGELTPLTEILLISATIHGTPDFLRGEYWRLVTPAFLHFGLMHIVFNMLWLFDLGAKMERFIGSGFLLAFFLVAAVLSNLAQFFFTGPLFGGMSGVVYGLLMFLWMQRKFNPFFFLPISRPIVIWMLVWFLLCWTGLLGAIANIAHTAGLLVGLIWGYIYAKYRQRTFRSVG